MAGLASIIDRIRTEAGEQAAEIGKRAEAKAEELLAKAREDADGETARILENGQVQAEQAAARVLSGAAMNSRKDMLTARQDLIDAVFEVVLVRLREMPEDAYAAMLTSMIARHIGTGGGEILLPEKDLPMLPQDFAERIMAQAGLPAEGAETPILAGVPDIPSRGGFILRHGPIDINGTFAAVLRLRRNDWEALAAEMLFQKDGEHGETGT